MYVCVHVCKYVCMCIYVLFVCGGDREREVSEGVYIMILEVRGHLAGGFSPSTLLRQGPSWFHHAACPGLAGLHAPPPTSAEDCWQCRCAPPHLLSSRRSRIELISAGSRGKHVYLPSHPHSSLKMSIVYMNHIHFHYLFCNSYRIAMNTDVQMSL